MAEQKNKTRSSTSGTANNTPAAGEAPGTSPAANGATPSSQTDATTSPATSDLATGAAAAGAAAAGAAMTGAAAFGPVTPGPATTDLAATGAATDLATSHLATSDLATTGPATTDLAVLGPAVTGLATTGAAVTGAATTSPTITDLATGSPATADLATGSPATADLATADPAASGGVATGGAGDVSRRYLRPTKSTNVFNNMVAFITRCGISILGSRVLYVRGRKTGEWRSLPVNLLTLDGQRYLVSPRGHSQWVRNLRATGHGELRVGRRVERFVPTELGDDDKPVILRAYLRRWKFEVGMFFDGVDAKASDEVLRGIAPGYPVFRITTDHDGSRRS